MADDVEFSLRLRNAARFAREADHAADALDEVGDEAAEADRKLDRMGRSARTSSRHMGALGRTGGRSGRMLGAGAVGLAGTLGTIGTAGVAALGAAGAGTFALGLSFANTKEQAELAFGTMLGGAKQGKAFVADLTKFAAETPFELPGLLQSSQALLAFGFRSEEVLPMMTSLGDAAAGLGAGEEGLQGMIRALGQMRAKGKASAEEMMQLTEQGVPAWQYLAKALGTDVAGAMDQVSAGQVDANTAITAITKGAGRQFGGLMAKQSQTLGGLWSTLKDNAAQAAFGIVEPFIPSIKAGMRAMSGVLSSPEFKRGMATFARVTTNGLGEAVAFVQRHWPTIKRVVRDTIEWLRVNVVPVIQGIVAGVRAAWPYLQAIIVPTIVSIRQTVEAVLALLRGDFGAAWDAIRGLVKSRIEGVKATIRGLLAFLEALGGKLYVGARKLGESLIKGLIDYLKSQAGRVRDAIVGIVPGPIRDAVGGFLGSSGTADAETLAQFNQFRQGANPGNTDTLLGRLDSGAARIRRAGDYVIGERRPELVRLPTGAEVQPLSPGRGLGLGGLDGALAGVGGGGDLHVHLEVEGREVGRTVIRDFRRRGARQ